MAFDTLTAVSLDDVIGGLPELLDGTSGEARESTPNIHPS
jgi:hypothetical protein